MLSRNVGRARQTGWIVVALVLTMLGATACGPIGGGGPSESAYKAGMVKVQAQLDAANDASNEAASATTPEARGEAIAEQGRALGAAAKAADALDPPEDIAATHKQFVSALEDYADLFDSLAKSSGDAEAEAMLIADAADIVDRLRAASKKLQKAGYVATSEAKDS